MSRASSRPLQWQSMQLTGNVDSDFIRMMRMHHLQGIEMARVEVHQGKDPEAKQMAQKILDEQMKDVKKFDEWLARSE